MAVLGNSETTLLNDTAYGNETSHKGGDTYVAKIVTPFPSWLKPNDVLTAIKPWINVALDKKQDPPHFWYAASAGDGLVWVADRMLWLGLRATCGDDPEAIIAAGDEALRRDYLYTLVTYFIQKRLVDNRFIGPNYYSVMATVISNSGRPIKRVLTPFFTDAFGVIASDLEKLKTPEMYKYVKRIYVPEGKND